ncbi:hypothetical protein CRE_17050 [Caenorhabditis remanei]|uniref:Uncharacterized protein n=1 Tax=Caenorhabditis remanei TaxID=31234 RepID=E3M9W5_CAERE|nr:hypothetical protein CRE_17050 [Caenorhabditis remanei]
MPCGYIIKYRELGRVWHQFNGNMALGVLHLPNDTRFKGFDWVETPRLHPNETTLTQVKRVIRNREWSNAFNLREIVALEGYLHIPSNSIRQDGHLFCRNGWLQWVHVGDEYQIPNTDWSVENRFQDRKNHIFRIYVTVQHLEIGLPVPGTDCVCYWKGLIPANSHSEYPRDNGNRCNEFQQDGGYDNDSGDYEFDSSRNSGHENDGNRRNDDRTPYSSRENGFGDTHDGWSYRNENIRDRQNGYQRDDENRLRSHPDEYRNQYESNWNNRDGGSFGRTQYNDQRHRNEYGSEGYGRNGYRPETENWGNNNGRWDSRRTQNEPDWDNYHQVGFFRTQITKHASFQEGSSSQYYNGRYHNNRPWRNDDFFNNDNYTNPHQEGSSCSYDHFYQNDQSDYAGNQFCQDRDEHRYSVADYPPDDDYTHPAPPMRIGHDGRFNFDDLTDEFIEESRQRARALFSHEENAVPVARNQEPEQHLEEAVRVQEEVEVEEESRNTNADSNQFLSPESYEKLNWADEMEKEINRELEEKGQADSPQETADQDKDVGVIQEDQQQVDASESETSESEYSEPESSDTKLEEEESSTQSPQNFNTATLVKVENDRGIERQVCIIRDPDFPWVQMDVHNWESTVKLKGQLFINRIVHQEGSTRYYEDWILGPVAINVHDCPDWTDSAAERGRRIPGSQFYCWWTVVVVTPLQPGPVFLEAQMQRENERRNLHQNMAAADQGEIMENENEQNRHQQNNEAVERIDGDREENRIENLNEEFLENGEQEDGNIVEDLFDWERSVENKEEDDLPNVAAPSSIDVNKNLKQQASPVEANTDTDGSVSPAARNGSRVAWPESLIPSLLLTVLTTVGIVCQDHGDYFLVAQLNSNDCSLLMKTETTENMRIKQGTQFEFKFQNFEVPFKKMASKIVEILRIVENSTIWEAVNCQKFRMVQYLTQKPEEMMRELNKNRSSCVVVSTYNHTVGIPACLISIRKLTSAEHFITGAIWCTLRLSEGHCNWLLDMPYDENFEKATTASTPMKSTPSRVNKVQRPPVFNSSTYHPDDGSSCLPGRRSKPKTRKPSESNSGNDEEKIKWADIAPVGTYIPDNSQNRGHCWNGENTNRNGTRGENPGRNSGSINHQRDNQIEKWIRKVNQNLGNNDDSPLYDGYRRAQRRNFELEDLPRGESSSGGAQNGPHLQQGHQFDR